MRRRRNEKSVFSKAKTEVFVHDKSNGGLWIELAKFSRTNAIFDKMGLFSGNLAIKVKNGIPFVRERTVHDSQNQVHRQDLESRRGEPPQQSDSRRFGSSPSCVNRFFFP